MRQILVEIEADTNLCDKCQGLEYVDLHSSGKFEDPSCGIFGEDLQQNNDGKAYRCAPCEKADQTKLRCSCGSIRGHFWAEEANLPLAKWACETCGRTAVFAQERRGGQSDASVQA
jgi:hypothetical protein